MSQRCSASGDRGLPVRGLIAVNDALADRLVQAPARSAHQGDRLVGAAGVRRLTEPADRRLERGLHRLVAQSPPFVLPDTLDLRLDVCHATASMISTDSGCVTMCHASDQRTCIPPPPSTHPGSQPPRPGPWLPPRPGPWLPPRLGAQARVTCASLRSPAHRRSPRRVALPLRIRGDCPCPTVPPPR